MNTTLGIIGAGQLGMYLCDAARRLGIATTILAEQADMPAVASADRAFIGALDDQETLECFLAACDVVTFEKEDIPNESLARIARAEQAGTLVAHPSAQSLFQIKDKGIQKQWLVDNGFPTLAHRLITGVDMDPAALAADFGLPLVQKARCGGYDGLGVQIIENEAQLDGLWQTPSIIETFLPDCREIAILVVRGEQGELATYAPVGMAFDERFNALSTVVTPAAIPPELASSAEQLAKDIVTRLQEVGVFAVEMFIDADDSLYINEISPRVHNSGHPTMEASSVSQFEQHVRAVTGLPLAPIEQVQPAAMVNVLYEESLRGSCPATPGSVRSEEHAVTVHWYGKPPGRIGRKMGHITALAESLEAATTLALEKLAKLPEEKAEEKAA